MVKSKKTAGAVAASRRELFALAGYLDAAAKRLGVKTKDDPLFADSKRLKWASGAIRRFLSGTDPSLDHAFGLIKAQGNQSGPQRWAERAAIVDREKLTVPQAAERFGIADIRSVIRGLKRGRELNSVAEKKHSTQQASAEIERRLDNAALLHRKGRRAEYERFVAESGARTTTIKN